MGNVSCCRSNIPKRSNDTSTSGNHHQDGQNYNCNKSSGHQSKSCKSSNTRRSMGNQFPSKKSKDKDRDKDRDGSAAVFKNLSGNEQVTATPTSNLQHISEREPDDSENDPSSNAHNQPIFVTRSLSVSNSDTTNTLQRRTIHSQHHEPLFKEGDYNEPQTNLNLVNQSDVKDEKSNKQKSTDANHNLKGEKALISPTSSEIYKKRKNLFRYFSHFNLSELQREINNFQENQCVSNISLTSEKSQETVIRKKSSSCATIFIDDSTISQPDLKTTIECVSLAVYYHIARRTSQRSIDIFDETIYPLQKKKLTTKSNTTQIIPDSPREQEEKLFAGVAPIIDLYKDPDQKTIYRYVHNLFNAALLTSEYAIITLVYIERLMTYAEIDILPNTWRRIFLGAIVLTSKVWEDQAVWNVDYCQILNELSVEDINELERQFLELIQFNMNVPSSVYAKYYFNLRTLAHENNLLSPPHLLTEIRARQLEVRQLPG